MAPPAGSTLNPERVKCRDRLSIRSGLSIRISNAGIPSSSSYGHEKRGSPAAGLAPLPSANAPAASERSPLLKAARPPPHRGPALSESSSSQPHLTDR